MDMGCLPYPLRASYHSPWPARTVMDRPSTKVSFYDLPPLGNAGTFPAFSNDGHKTGKHPYDDHTDACCILAYASSSTADGKPTRGIAYHVPLKDNRRRPSSDCARRPFSDDFDKILRLGAFACDNPLDPADQLLELGGLKQQVDPYEDSAIRDTKTHRG